MEIKGNYVFNAPIAKVWETMLDPKMLERCIPGCEELKPLGDDEFEAVLVVALGSIKGRYQAKITLTNQVVMRSYRLTVSGEGSPGFVRGEALVSLEEREGKTHVTVEGDAQVGGTIARVGQRLLGSVNKRMMDGFFNCLQKAASD